MANRFLKAFFIFLAVFVALVVAYWPAITAQYLYHDDVVYFMTSPTRLEPPGSLYNVAIGRFLGANLLIGLGLLVHSISDLNIIRFLGLLQLSICGFLFARWLRKHFLSLPSSLLIAIATFTLPPFQIMVSQAGMGFQPVGIFFALLAAFSAYWVPTLGWNPKNLFNKNILFSVLLLLAALSVYQPAAMFFWAILGFVLLFSSKPLKELAAHVLHFVWSGLIAFVFYGVMLDQTKKYFIKFNLWGYNPYSLTGDYAGKIKWFFDEPMISVLNLWNVFPQALYANLFLGFVLGAVVLKVVRLRQGKALDWKRLMFVFIILSGLVFAAFLPNLATESNIFFYRCAPALMALMLFFAMASAREYLDVFKKANKFLLFSIVLGCVALCGIVSAHQTIYQHRIVPSQREWKLFLGTLLQANLNQYNRIYVIEPQEEHLRNRGDEYRNLTTRYSHNMLGLLSCALRTMAKGKMRIYHIAYDDAEKKALFVFEDLKNKGVYIPYAIGLESGPVLERIPEGTLVIDMRVLHDF